MDSADGVLSIPIAVSPGRNVPELRVSFSSASRNDGLFGVGFSLSAASEITRCHKSMPLDAEIRAPEYNESDLTSLCLDGKRLVVVSQNDNVVQYRSFPDSQIRVDHYIEDPSVSYFEVFYPDGSMTRFGSTAASRPMANTGFPQKWLAAERISPRGDAILYDWCFAEEESGYAVETVLTAIRYSASRGAAADRAVVFDYTIRDDVQTTYSRGMMLQQSLQLRAIQSFGPNEKLAFRYEFDYDKSETTGRSLLQSVQQCGGDGTCFAPTRFHYAKSGTGFDDVITNIEAPLSDKASPMLFDVDHDGLPEYVVGDSTPLSTPSNPITEWRIAKNTGGAFAPEKIALLQEGLFVQDPEGPSDPTLLQPELGTSIHVNDDAVGDLFLHDTTGSWANHMVLAGKADLTFELVDAGIRRLFPLQQSPKGLHNAAGSVHLADCDGDSKPDLIQCTDKGDTPETALLSTWRMHPWQPSGFTPDGEIIDTLTGIPCSVEMFTVDTNRDTITDLVVRGYLRHGGVPIEPSGKYSAHRRRSNGSWEVFDTGLPTPVNGGRTLFLDANGDGLPDAIQPRASDGRLLTWINTGLGFADKPIESLPWDGLLPQSKYFHLAQPFDLGQDSKTDLLVPMVDSVSPDVPRWAILRSTGGTFEQLEAGIPFEPVVGDALDIADPRGPRVTDVDGNGSLDVAIFLGNKLHIFRNRAVDPDVLVGFSDGSNDHDSDEPGFIPNVSIEYGHLIDEAKTKGQSPNEDDVYTSQSDPANECKYPRNCVVGSKRVVLGYSVTDGQGGVRRFELRYRDGRSDRLHGWLGFGRRILVDVDSGATTATFYDNVSKLNVGERDVYPFVGQVTQQWRWAPGIATQPNPDQIEMAFTDRKLEVVPTNNAQTYFTLATQTHSRRMQGAHSGEGTPAAYVRLVETLENATMLRDSTVDVIDFDEFHNVLEVKASTIGVDATAHITRTVKNNVNKWMLGLPDTQTECSTGSGLTACRIVKRTTNEFGEVDSEETSSSDGMDDTKLKVVYDLRDKFGNVAHVTATDAFGHERESTTIYDDEGLFPIKHINALGHETNQEYDNVLGVLVKQTDPSGLITEWSYDALGRLESESRPDGSVTTIKVTRERIDGVSRTKERSTTTGDADDETILDSLGRPIRTFTHGPAVKTNTPRVMQVIEYDRLSGNVAKKSVPTAEGTPDASLKFDEYEFDALAREIRHVTPWNAVTTTSYDGLLIDVTDPLLKHTATKFDTLSRPVTITDAANGLTKYTYGPFGVLYTVTDPGNAITKWTHDAFGRPTKVEEPDRGTTYYVNNGFGDVLSSTDALGRVASWEFDALGRTTTRTDTLGVQVSTTTWTWDIAPHGIGRLHSVVSPDGTKT